LRKNKLVAIILLAALITSLSVYLYFAKKNRVILSGEMIASDGKGPYEEGADGVQTYYTKNGDRDTFFISMGFRSVWINFSSAHWMNESLKDIPSRFPSKLYVDVGFTIGSAISKMDIGERQSPPITIILNDPSAVLSIAYPTSLRGQSRIDLIRESQDRWTLDVDAWFESITREDFPDGPYYYVKLTFTMTIQAVPSYGFTG